MNKNPILIIAIVVLLLLGIYMIYLGTSKNMTPPTITGIGFLVIALAFLRLRNR